MGLAAALPRRRHPSLDRSGRLAGEIALGAAGLAVAGFGLYFVKERSQEEAEHAVIERDRAITLRRYARAVIAEVTRYGTLTEALDEGFRPLFDYIAARREARPVGKRGAKLAMTVPVTIAPADQAGSWRIRFFMPRATSRASLPEPANGVVLRDVPARTLAAVRFGGRATDRDLIAGKRDELLAWVEKRGLQALSEPEFATYNAPIVPGLLRRNEWWVDVSSKNGGL
jgi:hypothetical protein